MERPSDKHFLDDCTRCGKHRWCRSMGEGDPITLCDECVQPAWEDHVRQSLAEAQEDQ